MLQDPQKRVVAMDFSPDTEWLLCAGADSTLIIIPIGSLIVRGARQTEKKSSYVSLVIYENTEVIDNDECCISLLCISI